ncbi:MAG TPA: CDGSH iron-sulfur domain-containing protein [Candidatus Bathyarchaeia archaeon]
MENYEKSKASNDSKIRVLKNGPYLISGSVPLRKMTIQCDGQSTPIEWLIGEKLKTSETYSLCRCGQSNNKPFCDGTHVKVNFDGTEVSDNDPFDKMAKTIDGPALKLKDAEILCASARFCHRGGDIWPQIPKSDDSKQKQNAIRNACDCPSGRLVVIDKETGKIIEPELEKSIGFIEDPGIGVDGPIWVRGEIPVFSAEGMLYEVRNRVTLCRCGKSTNKPFCDSSHYPEGDREVIKNEQE